MSDILDLAKEYGIPTAIGVTATVLASRALWKQGNILSRVTQLEEDVDSVHDGCPMQLDTVAKMGQAIVELKIENAVFKEQLENFSIVANKMDSKLDQLITFHLEKK